MRNYHFADFPFFRNTKTTIEIEEESVPFTQNALQKPPYLSPRVAVRRLRDG